MVIWYKMCCKEQRDKEKGGGKKKERLYLMIHSAWINVLFCQMDKN